MTNQIITSLLDNDLYTWTVGQVAFSQFPLETAQYRFINRGKTIFPDGFADELKCHLKLMSDLRFSKMELDYLRTLDYFHDDYVNWLSNFRFDPSEVNINQKDGILEITIMGPWVRTIIYEVPVLALVSELFYKMTGAIMAPDWAYKIYKKSLNLSTSKCLWIDFGTRRRFSLEVQDEVVKVMKDYTGFMGTSNTYLAMKYDVSPNGTMSHQGPMAMMAKYGINRANRQWMSKWIECYKDKILVYLPDTFTTGFFLKEFNKNDAILWSGLRQDSGNPYDWMEKILCHYNKLGVPTENKKFIFSDNLTDKKYEDLSNRYSKYATIIGGIGTFLTNDTGNNPLNMVIKLTAFDGNPVVKLSDSIGKYTGNPDALQKAKEELGLVS